MAKLINIGGTPVLGPGRKIEDHAMLNEGTLLLLDLSIEECLANDATDYVGAVNLADANYKTLTGASESLVLRRRSGQTLGMTQFTAGRGLTQVNQGASSGINISKPSSSESRPAEFDAYLRAGGVAGDQPDLLFLFWLRVVNFAGTFDMSYFAEFDESPDLYQLDMASGVFRANETFPLTEPAAYDGLMQVGLTRDSLFVNGEPFATFAAANHDNALNALSPGNALHWRLFPSGNGAAATWTLYRAILEDTSASERTPLAAVQEDYAYVMSGAAGFKDIV